MATEAPNTLLSESVLTILDLLGDGQISGFVVKSGAYGNDPLCSTYYDDVVVRNLDGSYNFNVSGQGYNFNYALGTVSQTGITGFQKVENIIPLSANTRIANPPAGGGPWKPVIASFTSNTYPDADSIKVTVRVPSLLSQDDQGNTNPYSLDYAVDISLNNGPWVQQAEVQGGPVADINIVGKCTSPYLKTTVHVLPKTTPASDFYEWKVRVRRTSQNILSLRTQNEIYVDTIAVVSSNLYAYPNSVLVGTKISAAQFANIPSRAYEIMGLMVPVPAGYTPTSYPVTGGIVPATYPTVWLGNYGAPAWTDNPAFIFNDIVTNPTRGLGEYIPSGAMDKWSLYEIAQYCDQLVDDGQGGWEPNFTCNVSIQQPDDAYSVLLNLASTFRGMLYFANGGIHATQTSNKTPFTTFTNANVVAGQFSYSDTAQNTRATVATVKWVDPQNGYRENSMRVEDLDGILRYGIQEKQMTAFACTSPGQAFRLGNWTLQTERLLTETITFQTDMEGLSLRPGDAFGVYDNFRNNRSQGGRIIGFDSTRSLITLDRNVALTAGYVYSLTAITPKFFLDGTGDLTGSNQIALIRQPQIETFKVITPPNLNTNQLLIQGTYSTGVFIGSPWVLAASGSSNVFQNASFYTCLATAEVEPGKVEVLGLQANTGINFVIATGYTTATYPVNPGNSSSILPPSNLLVTGITGMTVPDNVFYCTIRSTWTNTSSPDVSYYVVSGKTFDTSYEGAVVIGTGYDFERSKTGQYLFKVAAVSVGGIQSSFITGGFLVATQNPLGVLRGLSGVQIVEDYDPLYSTATGYTGYIGTTPTFAWDVLHDSNGYPIVDEQFISGYRLSFKSFNGLTDYVTPFTVSGNDATTYKVPAGMIYSFVGGPQRGFDFKVQTVDVYGNVAAGASLPVNNPTMKPPFSSGFVGYNGGLLYNVTPSIQYDTSGIYLWMNRSPSFTPTYDNSSYFSTNLAGNATNSFLTGSFWSWFALTDTFGRTGNAIYGPISGNTAGVFASFQYDISAEISGAFSLLTGTFTNSLNLVSGQNQLTLQAVNGLSGQVVGTTPGSANTALNVRVDTAVVSSSGALSTQIDAVSARVQTSGQLISATVGTLQSALATTGGALASWIVNLGAVTSGANSTVQIGAQAFVTGDVNGIGGVAVANWGFKLDANDKVVSMQATSADWGAGSTEFGTIVFGGATLQSNTFVAGSAGWAMYPNGNTEFNNIVARGDFTGGSSTAKTSINAEGLIVGNMTADRVVLGAGAKSLNIYASNNFQTVNCQNAADGGNTVGIFNLYKNNAGTPWVTLSAANNGNISLGGGTITLLGSDGSVDLDGALTLNGAGKNIYLADGVIQKVTPGNWGPYLWDGNHFIELQYDGVNVNARIDNSTIILLG